jgi:hypothetical protein
MSKRGRGVAHEREGCGEGSHMSKRVCGEGSHMSKRGQEGSKRGCRERVQRGGAERKCKEMQGGAHWDTREVLGL